MDYIAILSNDEIATLCKIIGGKGFKTLFNKNPESFSRIKPGFRVNGLSDVDAVSIAFKNKDKSFIYAFINDQMGEWMMKFAANRERLEQKGLARDDILAETLADSVFSEQIELYFKLAGQQVSDDYLEKIRLKMRRIKSDRDKTEAPESYITKLETEIEQLKAQLSCLNQNFESAQAEYTATIESHKQEKADLKTAFEDAQKEIKRLQAPPVFVSPEIDDYDLRVQFDDTRNDVLSPIGSDEFVSLCEATVDFGGQKLLIRHADVSYNGQLELFQKNEEISPYFGNRDKLFVRDGRVQVGSLGVWNWSAIPNEKDSTKDYVITEFNPDIVPIEVVTILNCTSLEELTNSLQKGYPGEVNSRRVMFAAYKSKGKFVGVLCSDKDYVSSYGNTIFSDDVTTVPVYEFSNSELIRTKNGRTFYRAVFAGIPVRLYRVKSQIEIVRNIVLNSISWSNFKKRGAMRAEYKHLKDYIGELSTEDIMAKICKACYCTRSAATQLLKQFVENAINYIDGKSFDDEVIVSAIFSSESLMNRAKKLILADWEKENHLLLEEAQKKLDSLNDELSVVYKNLTEAQEALEVTKEEEKTLAKVIADKEQLAEDVEFAVAERIQQAKKRAADFIASMAFVCGQPAQATEAAITEEVAETSIQSPKYVVVEGTVDFESLEQHSNWPEVIDTAAFELQEAGVIKNRARGFAAYLCAAYIEKQPLLLVGPNAREIIVAFSAALSGQKHGVLYCGGDYSNNYIQVIGNDGENIVEIVNLFSSGWMNRLPEILSARDIFFVATHPYAEDIQVEPKSLFSFMLPVFTEFFVDKKATGNYLGGYFAENFSAYEPQKSVRKEARLLSHFSMNPFICRKIKQLLAVMHDINVETTEDDDFVFSILPLAYATMAMDNVAEALNDPQKGIEISVGTRRDLQFVLGEL